VEIREKGMAKIAIIVEDQVPQENRTTFDVQLRKHVEETLRDEGCLRTAILRHATKAGHVVLHELWPTRRGSRSISSGQVMTLAIKLATGC
jgi:hypothetical protein